MANCKGIDCAVPLTADKAKAMAAAGMKFVCRYLVPASMAWKRLTRPEAEAITATGMKIVSVFQRGANGAAGGATNGTRDGKAAYQEAKLIGQPEGTAIYFAVDFDAQPKDYGAIEAYLRAAAKELPGYLVGVYGSYAVVEEMARRKACTHFWQTYAWSKGQLSKSANIYQYKNGQTLAGHNVDYNDGLGNEGWWDTNPQEVDKTVDKAAAEKVIGVLGALWTASGDKQVQAAAHYAANALRDAAGIPR
ncbi:DUF1906 domain-containing protein [Brevibacillus agri]|uniref:DUF1906 domain-containing protein n=1 Tax=Brevibacillus agri TaxID=51101 RepID=UPI0028682A2D|nr:DUF1906 domain-containing protein [Brevibacillus agri]